MLEPDWQDLVHREIDGENTAAESARLRERMAGDPAVRALFEDVTRLSAAVGRIRKRVPPAALRDDILTALPAGVYARARPWPLRTFAGWGSRPALRTGLAFAAGLVIGIAGLFLLSREQVVTSKSERAAIYGGVLGPAGKAAVEPLASSLVDVPGCAGTVRMFRVAERLGVEFDLSAREPVEVILATGANGEEWAGCAQIEGVSGTEVRWQGRSVIFSLPGSARWACFLVAPDPATASIRVQVASAGGRWAGVLPAGAPLTGTGR